MDGGLWHCTGDRDQDHPHGKQMQKSKMAVWRGLTNSCDKKRSEKQRRKERYKRLNAEFQRIAKRDKKAAFSDQCKEIEENIMSGDVHVWRHLLCCWKKVFAMTSAFSWQNSISLFPASFHVPRPNLPVPPGVSWLPTFAFQSPIMKRTSFWGVLKGLVGLHRTV